MPAVFVDTHAMCPKQHKSAELWGAIFTEVLFADDTVLMTRSAESLQTLLQLTENIGKTY